MDTASLLAVLEPGEDIHPEDFGFSNWEDVHIQARDTILELLTVSGLRKHVEKGGSKVEEEARNILAQALGYPRDGDSTAVMLSASARIAEYKHTIMVLRAKELLSGTG